VSLFTDLVYEQRVGAAKVRALPRGRQATNMSDKDLVSRAVDDIEHGRGDGAWNALPGSWQNELSNLPQEKQFEQARQIIAQVEHDKMSHPDLPDVTIDTGFNKDGKTVDNLIVEDGDHKKVINIKQFGQHLGDAVGIVQRGKEEVEDVPNKLKDPFGINELLDR
jgi:hypothetical protein